jgi:drug/metabolite transporter, DME family
VAELTAEPARTSPRSEPPAFRAALLVLAGAALFGTVGTAQIVGPDVPTAQLGAARLLLGGALLVAIAVATGHAGGLGVCVRSAPAWWAGLGQAAFNLCFLGAMREAGVALGTLLAIGATPVLTGLVTRQVSRRWLVATTVAVGGLVLLIAGQSGSAGADVLRPSVLGVVLALGASASYATYIIAGNAASRQRLRVEPYLATTFAVAAVLTLPVLLLGDAGWALRPGGAVLLLYLAVVPTVLAYHLFNRGLSGVRPATASTLGLVEPVVAATLAVLVLGERLSAVAAIGAGLIVAGLLLIVRAVGQMGESSGD